ncbi:hypothetical protein ISN45_Aa01g028850 [Arabidopsis thaliana x Arabidopsis arenosa]|uniref:Uncharacterized protein n=1 Tax=Arabidopsis thaliana x Arabidopsis arenosa TaxID=1240361 RepID=A0A8T2C497_9BRAS|nr:hypothetical protein ISN45_Aa01g028850 [Arabidopsis thaliana x Arabidopsis arenosa]
MSSPAVYISDNEDDSQGIPVPSGDEVFTQRGDKFGPHFRSQSTPASLGALRRLCNIPQEIEFSLPGPNESPEKVREGYCCAYEVYFKGNQTIPRPTVDFLSFFRIVFEGETNWNSFTLQRIHKAGLAIKDGQTHPLDHPPEERDSSSLNARDKRKMQAETKALKDQLSEIGKKKWIAAISRVGNFHRKTLLVDDGSLEAALSIAVDTHGAVIRNDPPVAAAIFPSAQEGEREITSSPCTKRKAPDSDNLSNERLKSVRLSSPPRAPSPLHSDFPSSEPLGPEFPLPGDRVIPEETDERRSEVPLSQGLSGEEIGDILRSFPTRGGASLPPFPVWRPEIRQMYINRACYLSQEFMETNGIIFHYENLLHQATREIAKTKKEIDELRLVNQSERREQARALESSFENMKKTLAANEQRIRIANAERDSARSNVLRLETELEETIQRAELLVGNRARDIAEAEHNARKEMKGFGRQLIQSITKFTKDEEVWTKLLTDRAELKSNLDLIEELENGRVSFESEREEVAAELAVVDLSYPRLPLIIRHDELEDERKEIRKRKRERGKRCLDIARELHRLEAHPSDWIELGLQEYGNMPGCIMSIVDLAGQGAELFRNSRPF